MKTINQLFYQFTRGDLDDSAVKEMNRLLVTAWFESPDQLGREEALYAEDLIIENYNQGLLEEKYASLLKVKMAASPDLSGKVKMFGNLTQAFAKPNHNRSFNRFNLAHAGDPEELQLRQILKEVIINSEKAVIKPLSWQKTILSIAAVFLLVVFGWLLLKNDQPAAHKLAAENQTEKPQPEIPAENTEYDKSNNERIQMVVKHYFSPAKIFNYMQLRGEEPSVPDEQFILAAQYYNKQQYDQCLRIISSLITKKSFSDNDTLNELRYFSGNCLLIRGITSGDTNALNQAIKSFGDVSRDHKYYYHSRWYIALAGLKLGKTETGRIILDSLLIKNYTRKGVVKAMRDSIK